MLPIPFNRPPLPSYSIVCLRRHNIHLLLPQVFIQFHFNPMRAAHRAVFSATQKTRIIYCEGA